MLLSLAYRVQAKMLKTGQRAAWRFGPGSRIVFELAARVRCSSGFQCREKPTTPGR